MTNILKTMVVKVVGDTTQLGKDLAGVGTMTRNAGASISSAGTSLTSSVTLPIIAAGTGLLTFTNQFNAGMANVASLGEEAAAAVEGWGPMVQEIAVSTGKSTDDMTEGLYNVVSAFGVADDSLEVLDINARASAAGLATTADAINLTSAVTKAYGDTSAESVQHVADLALKTVQLGQTTFPELAASVGSVAPLAQTLGVSMEELFGVMATGTGVTGGASEVSTQLRGIIQSLMAPTGEMTALIESWGFANGTAAIDSMGLQDVINKIVEAAEESGQPLQKYIGSIEGQTLALALAGAQSDNLYNKTLAMFDATGAVNDAFSAQTEGVNAAGFAWQQTTIRLQVFAERLGSALIPAFNQVMTYIDPFVEQALALANQFAALDPRTQTLIVGAFGIAAAIGPLLILLGGAVTGLGAVAGAIGFLFSPIGLIIAVVALLGVAWSQNWGDIQGKTQAVIAWATPYIQQFLNNVTGWWDANGATVIATVTALWLGVQAFTITSLTTIGTAISTALTNIQTWYQNNETQIRAIVSALWGFIQSVTATYIQLWTAIINAALAVINGDWFTFGEQLRIIVDTIWGVIVGLFESYNQILANVTTAMVDGVKDVWNNTDWGAVGDAVIDGLKNALINGTAAIKDAAISVAKAAWEAFTGFNGISSPAKLWEYGGDMNIEGLRKAFLGGKNKLITAVNVATQPLATTAFNNLPVAPATAAPRASDSRPQIVIKITGPIYGFDDFKERVTEIVDDIARRSNQTSRVVFDG